MELYIIYIYIYILHRKIYVDKGGSAADKHSEKSYVKNSAYLMSSFVLDTIIFTLCIIL